MSSWIILGATSSMARAFARKVAETGAAVLVAGRDMEDLEGLAVDLQARGAMAAGAVYFDAADPASFAPIVEVMSLSEGEVNAAVFVGAMPTQAEVDETPSLIDQVAAVNYAGPARFLHELAPIIEERGGTVVGVTSVAGDRGRFSNYVYGSAKAGFATYLAGLRNRLGRSGAHVMTVKPGFVDTAMTWGVEGMFLVATPEEIADRIWASAEKKRNVIYAPSFWWVIMTIIKLVPEKIFKKLSF